MAFVQHKSGTSGNSDTIALAFDSNVTAANLLAIIVQIEDAGAGVTISSISGNSNTFVLAEGPQRGGSQNGTQWLYYVKVGNAGATTITVVFSATGYPKLSMYELSGRDATNPLVDSSANTGNAGVPNAGDLACGAETCDLVAGCQTGVGTPTEGTGFTLDEASSPYWYGASQHKDGQTGTQSVAFAGPSGGDWVSVAGAFKAAGAGGSTVTATPANASLSYQGQAPAIAALAIPAPANASLSFVGLLAVVYTQYTVFADKASLSFAGLSPSLVLQNIVTPANASLSFVGLAPTTVLFATVAPANASLSFVGLAPSVVGDNGLAIAPDNASLSFQGLTPSLVLHATLTPSNASLSFAGLTPTVNAQGATRGHAGTGRRWRGRVYDFSRSDEVAITTTITPAPIVSSSRTGLGAIDEQAAMEFLSPAAPPIDAPIKRSVTILPAIDADSQARIAREIRQQKQERAAKLVMMDEAYRLEIIEQQLSALIDVMNEQRARRAHLKRNRHHVN